MEDSDWRFRNLTGIQRIFLKPDSIPFILVSVAKFSLIIKKLKIKKKSGKTTISTKQKDRSKTEMYFVNYFYKITAHLEKILLKRLRKTL